MLRIGTLGTGRIVHRGLLPGVRGCDDCELVAAASLRPGVAAEFAREHGVPHAFDSYETVLARDDVDAVYVPTRGDRHAEWTIAAAEAGKHVLCEKPLARDEPEAVRMRDACRDAGVVLFEAFMYRHHPRTLRAAELVRGGAIGAPRSLTVNFSFLLDAGDWRNDPAAGGGAVWDLGCYGVNFARLIAGEEPGETQADAVMSASGVDLTTRIGLTFPGGLLANIECSLQTVYRCRVEIAGDAGRIELPDAFLPAGDAPLHLHRGRGDDSGTGGVEVITETFPGEDPYAHQMRHFVRSVESGGLLPPAEDGVANTAAVRRAVDLAWAD